VAEEGEPGDPDTRKHQGREEDADDGNGARHRVFNDDDVRHEEGKAEDQKQCAGDHRPAVRRGPGIAHGPPCDPIDEGQDDRHEENGFAHQDEDHAEKIKVRAGGRVRKGRANHNREHEDEDHHEEKCCVGEQLAEDPGFSHHFLVLPGWGISGIGVTLSQGRSGT